MCLCIRNVMFVSATKDTNSEDTTRKGVHYVFCCCVLLEIAIKSQRAVELILSKLLHDSMSNKRVTAELLDYIFTLSAFQQFTASSNVIFYYKAHISSYLHVSECLYCQQQHRIY